MAPISGGVSQVGNDEYTREIKDSIYENELNSLNNPTYHFRLFLANEELVKSGYFGSNKQGEQVTIAESGSTTVGIDNVEIVTTPGTTPENMTGTSVSASFTLIQPLGINLIDMIHESASFLGIKNYFTIPYFLELTFRGYDPETGDIVSPSKKWIWQLSITSVNMTVDSGGSKYNFEAAAYDNLASVEQYSKLKSSVSITAGTVGEFFNKLTIILNEQSRGSLANDKYDIVVVKEIAKEKLRPKKSDESPELSGPFSEDKNHHTVVSFNEGTSVQRIIDIVLSSTSYLQKKIKKTTDEDKNDSSDAGEIYRKLYRIETSCKINDYDYKKGDYTRLFSFIVHEYDFISNAPSQNEKKESKDSEKRIKRFLETHTLRKHYNYIFTGKNSEVLNFDFKFNMSWYCADPKVDGLVSNSSAFINSYRKKPNASIKQIPPISDTRSTDTKKASMAANFSYTDQSRSIQFPPPDKNDSTQAIDNDFKIASEQQRSLRIQGEKPLFIEDVYDDTFAAEMDEFRKGISDVWDSFLSKHPIRYIETNQSTDNITGVEDTLGGGRAYTSTVFTQAMHGVGSDMVNISLEIKGDPHWLSPGPFSIDDTKTFSELNKIQKSDGGDTYVESTEDTKRSTIENLLVFTVGAPVLSLVTGDEIGSGMNKTSIMNGVYGVITVRHKFSAGKFTQTLECYKDVITDVRTLMTLHELVQGDPTANEVVTNQNTQTQNNNVA